jgi:hypothetical protein
MARQAGFDIEQGALLRIYLETFAALIRADEREACAKVCEEYADDVRTGVTCAKAIRARRNT